MFRGASVAAAEKISWFSKTTQKKKNLLSLKPSDFLDKASHFTSQNTGGADLLCNFGVLSPMTVLSEVKLLFFVNSAAFFSCLKYFSPHSLHGTTWGFANLLNKPKQTMHKYLMKMHYKQCPYLF